MGKKGESSCSEDKGNNADNSRQEDYCSKCGSHHGGVHKPPHTCNGKVIGLRRK